jgi:hypothetical protein
MRTKLIPEMFEKVKGHVMTIVETEVGEHASLTTDIWTSEAGDSFLSLTLHYLNSDFKPKMVVLDCIPFNSEHTAENILCLIDEKLDPYQLSDKIHLFVRDNATNMVGAFEISPWTHVGCFLHILQVENQYYFNIQISNQYYFEKKCINRPNPTLTCRRKFPSKLYRFGATC